MLPRPVVSSRARAREREVLEVERAEVAFELFMLGSSPAKARRALESSASAKRSFDTRHRSPCAWTYRRSTSVEGVNNPTVTGYLNEDVRI